MRQAKRALAIMLAAAPLLLAFRTTLAAEAANVFLNGGQLSFGQPPVIENGRVLVPFRAIFEALGADVAWNGQERSVTAARGGTVISLRIGNAAMLLDGKEIALDAAPKIVNGVTLVPLRAVAEGLDAQVSWDGATSAVHISTMGVQTAVHVEKIKRGGVDAEYLVITGLPDADAQNRLNEELNTFFTWPLHSLDDSGRTLVSTAKYAIVGDRYISARAYASELEQGAAYPVNGLESQIYNLQTGMQAGSLADFLNIGGNAKALDAFVQTYPEAGAPGAKEALIDAFVARYDPERFETRFYLTETAFGLYLNGRLHAGGDYWAFEAKYQDIAPYMTPNLLSASGIAYTNAGGGNGFEEATK